jgi:hypothetical protein
MFIQGKLNGIRMIITNTFLKVPIQIILNYLVNRIDAVLTDALFIFPVQQAMNGKIPFVQQIYSSMVRCNQIKTLSVITIPFTI